MQSLSLVKVTLLVCSRAPAAVISKKSRYTIPMSFGRIKICNYFKSVTQIEKILHQINATNFDTSKFVFTFSSHTEYVKRESIVIIIFLFSFDSWVKNKSLELD